jgi:hypothetical protein
VVERAVLVWRGAGEGEDALEFEMLREVEEVEDESGGFSGMQAEAWDTERENRGGRNMQGNDGWERTMEDSTWS